MSENEKVDLIWNQNYYATGNARHVLFQKHIKIDTNFSIQLMK